jgi:hypothetical protein
MYNPDEDFDNVRIAKLYDVLYSYTNNIDEASVVRKMREDKATVKDYIYALADGIKYGNWPWVNVNKVNK